MSYNIYITTPLGDKFRVWRIPYYNVGKHYLSIKIRDIHGGMFSHHQGSNWKNITQSVKETAFKRSLSGNITNKTNTFLSIKAYYFYGNYYVKIPIEQISIYKNYRGKPL